jgi:hypothetical protein
MNTNTILWEGDVPAFLTAFVKAQKDMDPAVKGSSNAHFKNTYADIGAVLEAALPALNKHGISLLQFPGWDHEAGQPSMSTTLAHTSGGRLTFTSSCPMGRGDGPQAYGSFVTYLRRYTCQAALGLGSEDDDGEGAEGRGKDKPAPKKKAPAPKKAAPPKEEPKEWTDKQRKTFMARIALPDIDCGGKGGYEAIKKMCELMGAPSPSRMSEDRRKGLIVYCLTEAGKLKLSDAYAVIDYHTHGLSQDEEGAA